MWGRHRGRRCIPRPQRPRFPRNAPTRMPILCEHWTVVPRLWPHPRHPCVAERSHRNGFRVQRTIPIVSRCHRRWLVCVDAKCARPPTDCMVGQAASVAHHRCWHWGDRLWRRAQHARTRSARPVSRLSRLLWAASLTTMLAQTKTGASWLWSMWLAATNHREARPSRKSMCSASCSAWCR